MRLDGVSVYNWNKSELGKHLGYLPQDIELFDGTFAENITRFGEMDHENLNKAIKLANLEDFLEILPEGIETNLNADTLRIPGGIKQKIGLARALYGDPKLIVLDEPSSNMDNYSESKFLESIKAIKNLPCSLIIITHSKEILRVSDLVLTIENGRQKLFNTMEGIKKQMQENATKKVLEQQKKSLLISKKNNES